MSAVNGPCGVLLMGLPKILVEEQGFVIFADNVSYRGKHVSEVYLHHDGLWYSNPFRGKESRMQNAGFWDTSRSVEVFFEKQKPFFVIASRDLDRSVVFCDGYGSIINIRMVTDFS
ncbi:MAG: hypothetical protein KC736_02340 [Candidatus Moranbacteria bacterium]|nr:hypothetical protein [Candidatus Moranbacteria bacterium]